MKSSKDIEYVDLDMIDPAERAVSFFFEHFIDATYDPAVLDAPHRHNYQEMFIVQAGHGRHAIDGQSIELLPGTVSLIGKGHVHLVEHMSGFTGWIVRFSDDFLPTILMSETWNYHTTLFGQFGRNHSLIIPSADLAELSVVLDLMEAEWSQPTSFQAEHALRYLLALLVIRLERIYQNSLGTTQHERQEYRVYQQFMALLDQQFTQHHDVQFYAGALQIAPIRLSRILNRIVGRPTKQLIDERIMLEAKRYLQYTDRSVKEVAESLGYNDLFQFSKTFKRSAGVAPNAFRERVKK